MENSQLLNSFFVYPLPLLGSEAIKWGGHMLLTGSMILADAVFQLTSIDVQITAVGMN